MLILRVLEDLRINVPNFDCSAAHNPSAADLLKPIHHLAALGSPVFPGLMDPSRLISLAKLPRLMTLLASLSPRSVVLQQASRACPIDPVDSAAFDLRCSVTRHNRASNHQRVVGSLP